jgi:hypothetical protein
VCCGRLQSAGTLNATFTDKLARAKHAEQEDRVVSTDIAEMPNAAPIPEITASLYETLTVEEAVAFRQSADRIRSLGRKQNEAIVEIGRELIAAKKRWPRQFTAWLEVELRMNPRTALNYMHLADWGADKSEIVSVLSPASLYKLAAPSTPAVASDEVVSRIRSGEIVGVKKVLDIVSAAKDARAKAQREEELAQSRAKATPKQLKAAEQQERRREKKVQQEKAEREHKKQDRSRRCEQAAALLRERLGEDLDQFMDLVAMEGDWPLVDDELLKHLR